MCSTFEYAIDCKSRARFGWIIEQLQAPIIIAQDDSGDDRYTTTDHNTISVGNRYIYVIRNTDESIEIRGDIETSKFVMRPDGYMYLELYNDKAYCGTVRIQGLSDLGSDKEEHMAHKLYEMFSMMGTPWMA